MGRIALVTGATGFVGGHLVEHLHAKGWGLRALVRPTSDTTRLARLGAALHAGDLRDREAVRQAASGAEVVFHLAAVTGLRGEQDFRRANVEGTRTLVEAVLAAEPRPRRVVYLSSYAACGPANGRPRSVHDTPAPLTAYGRSKLEGEAEILGLTEMGVEVVVLRAPAVYGPGDHALLPYFRLVRHRLAPRPGGPDRRLHMIFVEDLAYALARAADAETPPIVAVAEPVEHRWADLVASMARATGTRPLPILLPQALVRGAAEVTERIGRWLERPVSFTREKAEEMLAPGWVCDLDGAETLLPQGSVTPLEVGMARTVEWYERQGWL